MHCLSSVYFVYQPDRLDRQNILRINSASVWLHLYELLSLSPSILPSRKPKYYLLPSSQEQPLDSNLGKLNTVDQLTTIISRSLLILSSHLRRGLPFTYFTTIFLRISCLRRACYMCHSPHNN